VTAIDAHPGLREAFAAYDPVADEPETWLCPDCGESFTFSVRRGYSCCSGARIISKD
jgi:hypothetical protein